MTDGVLPMYPITGFDPRIDFKSTDPNCPPYVRVWKQGDRVYGQIYKNGEPRWVRDSTDVSKLVKSLRVLVPTLDYVLSPHGDVLNTDCLSLQECIECTVGLG